MRYFIKFSYDGSCFHGYQIQPNLRTVQGELEKALSYINGKNRVIVHASGRTDLGVHARMQTATFDLDRDIPLYKLKMAINSNIGDDIHVYSVEVVSHEFHARFSSISKEYNYYINIGEYDPINRNYVYQYNRPLDIEQLKRNIKYYIGKHDFRSFVSAEDIRENAIREMFDAHIEVDKNIIKFVFVADGFLKYQVRNMVGTLLSICEGKIEDLSIPKILELKDRTTAGRTAPGEGLYLERVNY